MIPAATTQASGPRQGHAAGNGPPPPVRFVRVRPSAHPRVSEPNPPKSIALLSVVLGLWGIFQPMGYARHLLIFATVGGPGNFLDHVALFLASVGVIFLAAGLWKGRWWSWLVALGLAFLVLLATLVSLIQLGGAANTGIAALLLLVPSLMILALLRRSARLWAGISKPPTIPSLMDSRTW
jgi:hypothetical protein